MARQYGCPPIQAKLRSSKTTQIKVDRLAAVDRTILYPAVDQTKDCPAAATGRIKVSLRRQVTQVIAHRDQVQVILTKVSQDKAVGQIKDCQVKDILPIARQVAVHQ